MPLDTTMTLSGDGQFPTGRWPAGRTPMQFGLMLPLDEGEPGGTAPTFAELASMTRLASDVGVDIAWFPDHLVFQWPPDFAPTGAWECFTFIAGLAAATERIALGTMVACTGFRNAGLTAKMAEAIDEISGGRFILGLGAGWHEPEYEMFGYPFDHRVSRFEDAIKIIQPLLAAGAVDYAGPYAQANQAVIHPRGPRAGGPPIIVGTSGERMLRLTARYADAWNTVWHTEASQTTEHLARLDRACADVGRDPASIVRTVGGAIAMDGYAGDGEGVIAGEPELIAAVLRGFREVGFQHFLASLDPCTPETIAAYGRIIELVD
ncbi:MAG: LLM class flavin-dependent oxidoreductase [Thermomicrobiales bacterium]|nr:LLM class flavin-dependent oxidoreductase [Thermomicrobiales bacterium]